ncbi:MAG: hypothetical protein C7B46_13585 [Sulfobacillus benefaciens]|jgi:FMN phosphatase YigB (HAD superfamily)|uniref:HAD family hydrolase n=1 Tax=Sulfobacillus benefaciens TaxID=453960 RepID=A0A2T2XDJ7_9FIRM|nr:MAG: hypothetical protein C7B46_13585 [Sulfobacillus benefaciens]
MLKAILFDLDQTLLDLDGDAFLDAYVEALADHMAPLVSPEAFRKALWSAATAALAVEHPGRTNHAVIWETIAAQLPVSAESLEQQATAFNATHLAHVYPGGGPKPGAHAVIHAARQRHLAMAVATTPIYDVTVIRERLRRAGLDTVSWDLIASDTFYTTKPHPTYFVEVATRLGVAPRECLMVGDDFFADLPARQVGMATFYVGPLQRDLPVGPHGTLIDLATQLAVTNDLDDEQ